MHKFPTSQRASELASEILWLENQLEISKVALELSAKKVRYTSWIRLAAIIEIGEVYRLHPALINLSDTQPENYEYFLSKALYYSFDRKDKNIFDYFLSVGADPNHELLEDTSRGTILSKALGNCIDMDFSSESMNFVNLLLKKGVSVSQNPPEAEHVKHILNQYNKVSSSEGQYRDAIVKIVPQLLLRGGLSRFEGDLLKLAERIVLASNTLLVAIGAKYQHALTEEKLPVINKFLSITGRLPESIESILDPEPLFDSLNIPGMRAMTNEEKQQVVSTVFIFKNIVLNHDWCSADDCVQEFTHQLLKEGHILKCLQLSQDGQDFLEKISSNPEIKRTILEVIEPLTVEGNPADIASSASRP